MIEDIEIVKAYGVGNRQKGETVVVVIPKRIREKAGVEKGERFFVKLDDKNRIIYEPLKTLL